jgi:hypothetical protein
MAKGISKSELEMVIGRQFGMNSARVISVTHVVRKQEDDATNL